MGHPRFVRARKMAEKYSFKSGVFTFGRGLAAQDYRYRMISGLMPFRGTGSVSVFKREDLYLLPAGLVSWHGEASTDFCCHCLRIVTDDANASPLKRLIAFVHHNSQDKC